jgi:arylsulfatase A-like enzyme
VRVARYDCVHSSDAIADISLRWLRQRKQKDKPFFLMHHFKAPHDNFENAERYDWLYEDVDIPEPESLWQRGKHGPAGQPQYGTSVGKRNKRRNMGDHMFVDDALGDKEYKRVAYQRYLKKYLRCVKGVDDNIGRILDYLEKSGQLENTIIVYTADQGFMLGEHDYIDKRWMYEESHRMPFIVHAPGRIRPATVVDDIVNNADFAPTLLEFAGVETMPDSFQGRSFAANLAGRTPADWPTSTYYRYWLHMAHHDNPAHYGVRTKDHKLIFFYGLPLDCRGAVKKPTRPYWELYDLRKDPHEMNNVYGDPAYAKVTAELKAELLRLKKQLGDTDDKYPELEKRRVKYW